MDGEHCNETQKETGDRFSYLGNIFQPTRVRRSICSCDEIDRVLLDYGRNFLLPVGIILWAVLVNFII